MAGPFYLDYEGGSDAADGLSYANRWKTFTLGATSARIAPGETIRVMGSLNPTSLGINGTWTNRVGGMASTVTITSSTNASPIVVTATAHGYSNGDTVYITGHTTNVNANGIWEIANVATNTFELVGSSGTAGTGAGGTARLRNNAVVRLASALTQNIASCANRGEGRVAWTAVGGGNVTTSLDTTLFKCADCSDTIAVAAGFTTGLAAYFPTGTLDLSGYQQVSFWVKQISGTVIVASAISLKLCSDTAGATPVNTINIPAIGATGQWMPVTIDTGGALGASIQSIGFYVNTDSGSQSFQLNNIIACKASSAADSLSLTSLIGKNTTGETFLGIQSINGTRVMLDNGVGIQPNQTSTKGYSGTTETVTAYKRETTKTVAAAAVGTVVQAVNENGADFSLINYEGGWNRTDMSTQDGETWFDGQNGFGIGIGVSSRHFNSLNKISCVRYGTAGMSLGVGAGGHVVTNGHFNNNTSQGLQLNDRNGGTAIDNIIACNNSGVGVQLGTIAGRTNGGSLIARSNASEGVLFSNASQCIIDSIVARNNGTTTGTSNVHFATASHENIIKSLTSTDGTGAAIENTSAGPNTIMSGSSSDNQLLLTVDTASGGILVLKNFVAGEAAMLLFGGGNVNHYACTRIQCENYDNTPGDHRIFTEFGQILSIATDPERHTASGYCWALQPLNANTNLDYPIVLQLAKIACEADSLVTVKAFMKRTNTALSMRLRCRRGQIEGVEDDVYSDMTAAANTYEELTITFTPTEDGVVEILAEADGGTTYTGYVDDLTITQA